MIKFVVTDGEKYNNEKNGEFAIRFWEEGVYDNHLCFWYGSNPLPIGYKDNDLSPKDKTLTLIAIVCFYRARKVNRRRALKALLKIGFETEEASQFVDGNKLPVEQCFDDEGELYTNDNEYIVENKNEEVKGDVVMQNSNEVLDILKSIIESNNKAIESNNKAMEMNKMILEQIANINKTTTVQTTKEEPKKVSKEEPVAEEIVQTEIADEKPKAAPKMKGYVRSLKRRTSR